MPHLGVASTVKYSMIDDSAAADAGADRNVEGSVQAARRTPPGLRQRRAIHIGVKTDRYPQRPVQRSENVEIPPAGFRRIRDMTVCGRARSNVNGSKTADARGDQRTARKEIGNPSDRLFRLGGGKFRAHQIVRPGPHAAYKLGTACFHRAVNCHFEFGILKVYMRIFSPHSFFLLAFTAVLGLAQESVKPGTPGPQAAADAVARTAATVPADAIVISVGDDKLTRAQYESLITQMPAQAQQAAQGPNKRKVAEQIADLKAMAQEARKRNMEQQPGVQQLIRLQVDQALAGLLFKDIESNVKTDDASVKAYYDAHKDQFEEAKASHILIRYQGSSVPLRQGQKDLSQEEALAKATEIRKKLVAGGSFSDMAKAESDDTGSGANGGSLGSFGHGQMVPEFEKAVFTGPVGQISEPIKTQFGYHVIKVEDRKSKTFDEVKDEIGKKMKPQQAQKAVEDIRKQGNITINEAYFGK